MHLIGQKCNVMLDMQDFILHLFAQSTSDLVAREGEDGKTLGRSSCLQLNQLLVRAVR